MKLQEISHLIEIRNYAYMAVNNFSIDRKVVKELQSMLILLDKRIIEEVSSTAFKDYIGFEDAGEAVKEAMRVNDIRKDMKPVR